MSITLKRGAKPKTYSNPTVWTEEARQAIFDGKAHDPKTWSHIKGMILWGDGPERFQGPPHRVTSKDGILTLEWQIQMKETRRVIGVMVDGSPGPPDVMDVQALKGSILTICQSLTIKE